MWWGRVKHDAEVGSWGGGRVVAVPTRDCAEGRVGRCGENEYCLSVGHVEFKVLWGILIFYVRSELRGAV